MKLDGEEVEPVLRFDDLKEGMLVRVRHCGPRTHRHQLIRLVPSVDPVYGPVWTIAPEPPCFPVLAPGLPSYCLSPTAVERRCVFRVVDGLDPAADAEQDRQDRITADVRRAIHGARDQLAGRFR